MRQVRLDERTSIMAWGCEIGSCLTRGLIAAVVCLPIYDLVIGDSPQKMVVEPNSKQPSRREGSQEPEFEPELEPRRERQRVAQVATSRRGRRGWVGARAWWKRRF